MYKTDRIAPWPILDIDNAITWRGDTLEVSTTAADKNVLLDTANLGGNMEAYICNGYGTGPSKTTTVGASERVSFGALLAPLVDYGNGSPIYIDINISAFWTADEQADYNITAYPWVGFIKPSLTPTDGWDATNNLVNQYAQLPNNIQQNKIDVNTQVLIKDITSGGLATDQYVCVGFTLCGGEGSNTIYGLEYVISARYSYSPLATYYAAS